MQNWKELCYKINTGFEPPSSLVNMTVCPNTRVPGAATPGMIPQPSDHAAVAVASLYIKCFTTDEVFLGH